MLYNSQRDKAQTTRLKSQTSTKEIHTNDNNFFRNSVLGGRVFILNWIREKNSEHLLKPNIKLRKYVDSKTNACH